jgi:FXSXX-COOH protein
VGFVTDVKVSAVPDLRDVPLAVIAVRRPEAQEETVQRVLPETFTAPVPVTAFSSAI